MADGCDAGIRVGESLAEHMVALPITPPLSMAVVDTPAYFKRHAQLETPADLAKHNCLRFCLPSGAIVFWEFTSPSEDGHSFTLEPVGSLTTNEDDSMVLSCRM